jgi:hypothetical protein
MAERSERLYRFQQSQQSQRSQFGDSHATPSGRGTRFGAGGLPTPETGNSFAAPSEASTKRFKTGPGLAEALTPTPARTRDVFAGAWGAAGGSSQGQGEPEGDAEITKEVLDLLRAQPVSGAVRQAVRERLNRHARVVQGVERGRNETREKLKSSKGQIAELQERVVELENERRMRRALLRNDLEALSQGAEE